MERVSISLPEGLLRKFDEILKEKGYVSRSEGIRDAIRSYILEHSHLAELHGKVAGIVVLTYDHQEHNTSDELTDVQHHFYNIIQSTLHLHLDEKHCMEAIVVKGDGNTVKKMVNRLASIKGVKNVKLTASFSEIPE